MRIELRNRALAREEENGGETGSYSITIYEIAAERK